MNARRHFPYGRCVTFLLVLVILTPAICGTQELLQPADQMTATPFTLKGVFAYREAASRVRTGDVVSVHPEPTNPHDPGALCVKHDGGTVGYIARGSDQVAMRGLLSEGITVKVMASDYDYIEIAVSQH